MKHYIPNALRVSLQKIRLFIDYCHALALLSRRTNYRPPHGNERIVVFDLSDPELDRNFGRYTYLLIKFFSINGWYVVIKNVMEPVANLKRLRYKKWLLAIPDLQVKKNPDTSQSIYVYDKPAKKKKIKARQFIHIKDFKHGEANNCEMMFPFTMHPFFYEKGRYRQVKELRKKEHKRLIKILFSGKMNTELYAQPILKERYNVLNRIDILYYLHDHLERKQLLQLESSEEFDNLIEKGIYHNQFIYGERILKIGKWLEGLSKSDFFLACPGTDMPMCHNIIEAMGVGCIPIIEFPEQLTPSLQDGVNCIAFSGKNGLGHAMQQALDMDQQMIFSLRQGVIDYYETYLDPGKVVADMTQASSNDIAVCMTMS